MHALGGGTGQAAVALDARDLVLFDQEVETLGVLDNDAVFALLDGAPVEGWSADAIDAELRGVQHVVPYIGVEQQRLGGDAADVQAGSAQLV